jgi:hypothetical protein
MTMKNVAPSLSLKFLRARVSASKLALPVRVVGVLNGQIRQLWFAAFDERLIRGKHFVDQNLVRPVVIDDVVHVDEQHILFVVRVKQSRAH